MVNLAKTYRPKLLWPQDLKRTRSRIMKSSPISFIRAVAELEKELKKAGIQRAVLTSNCRLNHPKRDQIDPGVALYFEDLSGRWRVYAFDKYFSIIENVRTITKMVEMCRSIKELGVKNQLIGEIHHNKILSCS